MVAIEDGVEEEVVEEEEEEEEAGAGVEGICEGLISVFASVSSFSFSLASFSSFSFSLASVTSFSFFSLSSSP